MLDIAIAVEYCGLVLSASSEDIKSYASFEVN